VQVLKKLKPIDSCGMRFRLTTRCCSQFQTTEYVYARVVIKALRLTESMHNNQ